MKKLTVGVVLLMAIVFAASILPTVVASTVCSHPIYPDVQVKKEGHWVYLDFYAKTRSLQIPKLYTKFVYLEVDKKDLDKVGLRYHEGKPQKNNYFMYTLYQVPDDGKLYLEDRKLWLPDGNFHLKISYYTCGIQIFNAILSIDGTTATVSIENTK
ncbi:hypothetical protein GM182_01010 [bacterium 3DAC]|jgi:hypothetical protein|nr:hypothetical protein [Dictyoglomota bacterium]UZN22524.1 hypothetical protein GM182_01010 [bacterium 3DAC]